MSGVLSVRTMRKRGGAPTAVGVPLGLPRPVPPAAPCPQLIVCAEVTNYCPAEARAFPYRRSVRGMIRIRGKNSMSRYLGGARARDFAPCGAHGRRISRDRTAFAVSVCSQRAGLTLRDRL